MICGGVGCCCFVVAVVDVGAGAGAGCATMGGIVGQEVLNACSGTFRRAVNKWWW